MFLFFLLFKIPAWILGWRVFTLPPNISGEWVNSETSRHLNFNFLISSFFNRDIENLVKKWTSFFEKKIFWLTYHRYDHQSFFRESSEYLQHSALSPKRFGQLEMKIEQKARPPPKRPFLGWEASNWKYFFSTHRMYIIRCALDLCDTGAPFEYLKHVCDVKTFFSRLVWSSKIP